jgi:Zn-dependent protease
MNLSPVPQGYLFAPFGPLPSPFTPELDWRIFLVLLGAILLASTFHQLGHAFVADRLGDPLPRRAGRLGLSPFAHLSISGFVVLVVSLLFSLPVGWGKPVPTNPENYKTGPRLGVALVALGGPFASLLLAVGLAPLGRLLLSGELGRGPWAAWSLLFVALTMLVSLSLFLFNLLPIAPLDGVHVLQSLLPPVLAKSFGQTMRRVGPVLLFVLVMWGGLGEKIAPVVLALFRYLMGL